MRFRETPPLPSALFELDEIKRICDKKWVKNSPRKFSSDGSSNQLALKKFQIRGLGWCVEVTAHKLSPSQVECVRTYAKDHGEDIENLGGSLEDILVDYDCYNTNLWQSGILPFLHATRYALVDNKNEIIYSIDDLDRLARLTLLGTLQPAPKSSPRLEIIGDPAYAVGKGAANVLVYTEEHKGTTSVWEIESETIPTPTDLTFRLHRLCIGDGEIFYVDGIIYKGKELERNFDEEMLVGKAAYSGLF